MLAVRNTWGRLRMDLVWRFLVDGIAIEGI